MAELHITLADGRASVHRLGDDSVVIGRDPTCEVALDEPSASRRHALIRPSAGGYVLDDMGSKNGTLVNDVPTTSARLLDGDTITVGAMSLVFVDRERAVTTTSVVLVDEPRRQTTSFSSRGEQLSLPQRRLQMLYELSGRLTSLREGGELLEDAMNICFETLRFERGAIAVRQPNHRAVDWPVVRNLRDIHGELTISRSIVGRALDHGERAIINEGDSNAFDPTVSMVQHGIRSAMCVPLMHQDEVLGVIYGDRVSTGTVYSDEDVDFLAGLGRQVSIGLVNSRLLEEQKLKVRMENELSLAHDIQRALFPAVLPDHERLQVSALNEPGRHVSGDYYDVFEMPEGRLGLLIADVTGEGIAAAMLMANLQAAVRVTLPDFDDPGLMLARWNRLVHGNTDASKFITCLAAIVDPERRTLSIASAGHPPPYLLTLDPPRCRAFEVEPGFPLGVVEEGEFPTTKVDLGAAPCTVFCWTDGVSEAMNAVREEFGEARMRAALGGCESIAPGGLIRAMRRAIKDFAGAAPQSDDITMLAACLR